MSISLATVSVLGYPIAQATMTEASTWCLQQALGSTDPRLVVTINPEIIVAAEQDPSLKQAIHQADLIVADGVGVLWAGKQYGHRFPERIPGVELMTHILAAGGAQLRVYFLGSQPGIAQRAAEQAQVRFGTHIAGVQHGYFQRPDEVPEILAAIRSSQAHLLLAGLGPGQELFLHQHREALCVPLLIGVGGALDVLSGEVERTPLWTRRLGLEWAYRVGSDPKRWHRFPRLLRFVRLVLRNKP